MPRASRDRLPEGVSFVGERSFAGRELASCSASASLRARAPLRARERLLGGSQLRKLRLDPFQLIRGLRPGSTGGSVPPPVARARPRAVELGCPRAQCQRELGQCGLALAKSGLTLGDRSRALRELGLAGVELPYARRARPVTLGSGCGGVSTRWPGVAAPASFAASSASRWSSSARRASSAARELPSPRRAAVGPSRAGSRAPRRRQLLLTFLDPRERVGQLPLALLDAATRSESARFSDSSSVAASARCRRRASRSDSMSEESSSISHPLQAHGRARWYFS